jgi:hypothetical protein
MDIALYLNATPKSKTSTGTWEDGSISNGFITKKGYCPKNGKTCWISSVLNGQSPGGKCITTYLNTRIFMVIAVSQLTTPTTII